MLWVHLFSVSTLLVIVYSAEKFTPFNSRFAKDALIRIQHFEDNRRSLILAEEERIVQLLLDSEDNIVDCLAARRKYHLLENLMSEVERFEETGKLPHNVSYVEQSIDVGWYGRRCRKVKRDQLREAEARSRLGREIALTHWVEVGLPGTNFCSRQTPSHAFLEANIGQGEETTPVDTCCMSLWSCEASPSHPLLPLAWSQGTFNPLLWPVWSCDCLATFLGCLRDSKTQLGRELAETWQQYGGYCSTIQSSVDRLHFPTD